MTRMTVRTGVPPERRKDRSLMKKRKISRLTAILCALALMLTLSPAVFAATPFVSESIKVNSIVNLPAVADIRVKSNR